MSQSDDLSKLFQRFGGRTETYKEIVREDAAAQARERWPLLSAMRVDRAAVVPAVQPAMPPGHEFARPAAEPAASPAPLWRAAVPASEPRPAAGPVRENVGHEAPSAVNTAVSGMEPRFRTPEGMAPLAPAARPLTPAAPAQAIPAAPAAVSGPAIPAPQQSSLWAPVDPNHAPGTGTELNKVFARLEGRKEPGATSERAPARRSFLDRLNRS